MNASEFLHTLYPDKPENLYLLIWTKGRFGSKSLWVKNLSFDPQRFGTETDVYFGLGLSQKDYGESRRCVKDEIAGIPGFWADIDYQSTGHKKKLLPETEAEALSLIDSLPYKPSLVVKTGGGFHAYWLFKELWIFDSSDERERADRISQGWQQRIRTEAQKHGWTIDGTADISRVLRMPETVNTKYRNIATVERVDDRRFNPDDFEPFLSEAQTSAPIVTGSFIINPQAQPNYDKLQFLLDTDPKFKQTWELKRKDFPSQSEYDFSIISIATRAGLSVQEAVDLVLTHIRKQGRDFKDGKHDRPDYYLRAVEKARHSMAAQEKKESVTETAVSEQSAPLTKEEKLARLSDFFQVRIERVVKIVSDPSKFKIYTDTNQRGVTFGEARDIYSFSKFRGNWGDLTGKPLPEACSQKTWTTDYAPAFLAVAEEQDPGEEGTEIGTAKAWVRHYANDRPPLLDFERAIKNEHPLKLEENFIGINMDHFARWVWRQGEKMKRHDLFKLMRLIGQPQKIKAVGRRVWKVSLDAWEEG